jgi:hypothetical protein
VDGHNDERGANVLYPDVPVTRDKVNFIEPMLLLPAETLPEGSGWTYELKLVGFRAGKGRYRFCERDRSEWRRIARKSANPSRIQLPPPSGERGSGHPGTLSTVVESIKFGYPVDMEWEGIAGAIRACIAH